MCNIVYVGEGERASERASERERERERLSEITLKVLKVLKVLIKLWGGVALFIRF